MKVTSNTNPYVYEYKKPNETQSRFVDILAEMKLSSFEGNRLNVRLTPSREPSDDSVARTSVYDGKIARWEDCGIYEAPETPELRESVHVPTFYEQRLSGFFLGLSESAVYIRLQELAEQAAAADYTGMSDVEIYESIQNRYEEAFGKDFLDAGRLHIASGTYGRIWVALYEEQTAQFGSTENINEVNRKRLYGDMSDDEIQDQIRAKYPDKLTNRDLFMMMSEMGEVGAIPDPRPFLMAYVNDYSFDVDGGKGTIRTYDYWLNSLDKPVSSESLIAQHNAHKISQFPEGHISAAVLSPFLLKYFDVHLNADGFMVVGASRSELINDITNSNK